MPLRWGWVLVHGPSMVPAMRSGDVLLVRWGVRADRLRPGDVVVVNLPDRPLGVKRLVGYDDGRPIVEGDNPWGSTDSRQLGPLAAGAVRAKVVCRLWPRPGPVPSPPSDKDS